MRGVGRVGVGVGVGEGRRRGWEKNVRGKGRRSVEVSSHEEDAVGLVWLRRLGYYCWLLSCGRCMKSRVFVGGVVIDTPKMLTSSCIVLY